MTELAVSVLQLARSPEWAQIRAADSMEIAISGRRVLVRLVQQRTGGGRFVFFVCPRCHARARRDLYVSDGELGCRGCLRLETDARLAGPRSWDRQVVLPSRQITRITELLQHPMPWNARRRLLRRRARLLRQVETALAARRLRLSEGSRGQLGMSTV